MIFSGLYFPKLKLFAFGTNSPRQMDFFHNLINQVVYKWLLIAALMFKLH